MPDLFTVAKFQKYVGAVYATGGEGGGSCPGLDTSRQRKKANQHSQSKALVFIGIFYGC